jgi:DnaK suppressor protein
MKENLEKKVPIQDREKSQSIVEGEITGMEANTSDKSDDFRSSFLENLNKRKEELEEALKHLMGGEDAYRGMLSSDDFIEVLDRAERETSNQIKYSLIERKNMELGKIQYLISSILRDEDFGLCEDCGRRIPEDRLLIVPEATRCVRCQRKTEKLDSKRSLPKRSHASPRSKRRLTNDLGEIFFAQLVPLWWEEEG